MLSTLSLTDDQWLQVAIEHERAGRSADAEAIYRHLLPRHPQNAELRHALGLAAQRTTRWAEAVQWISEAIALEPRNAVYFNNLGASWQALGEHEKALAAYEEARRLAPEIVLIEYNLGFAKKQLGRWAEAAGHFRTVIESLPEHAPSHLNLGLVLLNMRRVEEAVAVWRAALLRLPGDVSIWINLGNALQLLSDSTGAAEAYHEALRLEPENALAWYNLGDLLAESGRADEAIPCFARSLRADPMLTDAHGSLIFTMHLLPSTTPEALAAECRRWWQAHGAPRRAAAPPVTRGRNPNRRLRIGLVSPDYRDHPVSRHLLPVLRAPVWSEHDLFFYSDASPPDEMTALFRALPGRWSETVFWSNEQLAARIREDGIDLLVDLSLHSAGHRLLVFAEQPAPVQVSFAGYPGSTGLETISYRLTDRFLEPPGQPSPFEDVAVRLPHSFWCFDPHEETPPVGELPAQATGEITFACLNKVSKTHAELFGWWSKILRRVPRSRLLMLCPDTAVRDRIIAHFREGGLDGERLLFTGRLPRAEYLALHQRIDVMLDPFPYNGHMTTCDALWMGVPVVTPAGATPVSRGGLSLLSCVGLPELIATSPAEYVGIAAELATDIPRLAALRANLRVRVIESPLTLPDRFAHDLVAAFRWIWRDWCSRPS